MPFASSAMAKKPDKEDGLQRRKAGVSLQRFAGAKKSKYDKKARAERKAAINAKRVNKYRKLKKRLDGNHTEGVQHAKVGSQQRKDTMALRAL